MSNTLVFSCDHRQTSEWKMPYIRVGSGITGSVVNTKSDQFLDEHSDLLSEVSKQLFILDHITEFGDPDFVGFANYRRAFTQLQPNNSMIPLYFAKWSQFESLKPQFMTSSDFSMIFDQQNYAGAVVKPWYDYGVKYSNCIQLTYCRLTSQFPEYQFTYDECNYMIQLFVDELSKYCAFDKNMIMNQTINYHLMCFVFSRSLCQVYSTVMRRSIDELMSLDLYKRIADVMKTISVDRKMYFRWVGYICEIWYSLFVYAVKQNYSILEIPMIIFED